MRRSLLLAALWLLPLPAQAQDTPGSLSLTVYQGDAALVRDRRTVNLGGGAGELVWDQLSPQLQPESTSLRTVTGGPVNVQSRSFSLLPLSAAALLDAYRGQTVTVRDGAAAETGTLLAAGEPAVVSVGGQVRLVPTDKLAFPRLPDSLPATPSVSLRLTAEQAGSRQLELAYLSGGFGWRADHHVELGDDRLSLQTWATLTNGSGLDLIDARVQLAAGGLQRSRGMPMPYAKGNMAMAPAAAPMEMDQAPLEGMHLYKLDQAVTLPSGRAVQLSMARLTDVAARRELVVTPDRLPYTNRAGQQEGKAQRRVVFDTDKPLPAGTVRVFSKGELIGEDQIEHSAKGRTVRLDLGPDMEVTVERIQTESVPAGPKGGMEQGWLIRLANAKDQPATVLVREPLPGRGAVIQESQPHKQEPGEAVWTVAIPANGKAELTYRLRIP